MRTMSFNLLCAMVTKERAEAVIQTIKKYSPDTVGIQEATPQWMDILRTALGDEYDFAGRGRDDTPHAEYSAVMYKRSVFELIKTETKWLSDTPDVISKINGSLCTRIFTYAQLKCKKCGKIITYINTHLDHADFGNSLNSIRAAQAKYIADFVNTLGKTYVVLTGDLNATPDSTAIEVIKKSGLSRAAETAKLTDDVNTFDGCIIDYIFVFDKLTDVSEYKVCEDKINGEYPSDHRPIYIDYKFI